MVSLKKPPDMSGGFTFKEKHEGNPGTMKRYYKPPSKKEWVFVFAVVVFVAVALFVVR